MHQGVVVAARQLTRPRDAHNEHSSRCSSKTQYLEEFGPPGLARPLALALPHFAAHMQHAGVAALRR